MAMFETRTHRYIGLNQKARSHLLLGMYGDESCFVIEKGKPGRDLKQATKRL